MWCACMGFVTELFQASLLVWVIVYCVLLFFTRDIIISILAATPPSALMFIFGIYLRNIIKRRKKLK